jgi:glycosyltransferase involved in cell wall biosynthesis
VPGNIKLVPAPHNQKLRRRLSYIQTVSLKKFDLIHTGAFTHIHYPLSRLAHLRNRNLAHVHSFRVDIDQNSEFPTKRRKKLAHMADITTAVSKHTAKTARHEFGVDPVVIYNGVDTNAFHPNYDSPEILSEHAENSDTFVFVGSLVERKRPFDVLDVAKRMQDISFIVIGGGPLSAELYQRAEEIKNIHFTGRLPKSDLPEIYANAAGLLFPSIREGCPNVVLESMACGTPVVGYNVTSMPELVNQGLTGYLCDTGKVTQLERGVEYVLENRDVLGEAARDYIVDNHRFEKIAREYERVYSNLGSQQ